MMQLLVAIVQGEDAGALTSRLNERGFRVTRINTVGGFLQSSNVTTLIGVDEDSVPDVMSIIHETCHTRRKFISAAPWAGDVVGPAYVYPIEVEVGGATVFALPVRRFARLLGGEEMPATDESWPSKTNRGDHEMNLVLTVLKSEDADRVADALLAAGYRLTRIATAGGFLRRGNVTLLIGVEEGKVDDVLKIMRSNCQPCRDPNPLPSGMPTYSATVFVLEASSFLHV